MAGRPKKKPEYNPELQFNNFLQELRDAYEEAASLRSLADELNISLLKLRKLLITADVFTSDICTEINNLHQSGKKISEIMKLTGLSRASVHSYLPYTKGLYNATEISLNAERCRTYKIRQEQVRLLKETLSEENLWQAVIAFQEYPFKTATGLPFRYKLKVGKNGEYNRELLIDRREKSKSLAWSSVVLAFENSKRISEEVKKPKALGDIRGVSYIYPILWRFGLIRVPEGEHWGQTPMWSTWLPEVSASGTDSFLYLTLDRTCGNTFYNESGKKNVNNDDREVFSFYLSEGPVPE